MKPPGGDGNNGNNGNNGDNGNNNNGNNGGNGNNNNGNNGDNGNGNGQNNNGNNNNNNGGNNGNNGNGGNGGNGNENGDGGIADNGNGNNGGNNGNNGANNFAASDARRAQRLNTTFSSIRNGQRCRGDQNVCTRDGRFGQCVGGRIVAQSCASGGTTCLATPLSGGGVDITCAFADDVRTAIRVSTFPEISIHD